MSGSSKKPLIVMGAGGHASVVVDCLVESTSTILGVVDPALPVGDRALGMKVLGSDDKVFEYSPEEILLVNGIGMVEFSTARRDVSKRMRQFGYKFQTIVHSSAITSNQAMLEEGVQIMAGVILQPGIKVGCDSIVNTGALIDHDCVIGMGCHICPGVTLAGNVIIGDGTMIGSGSTVLPGTVIGSRVLIGAGATIYHDIESGTTVRQRPEEVVKLEERP